MNILGKIKQIVSTSHGFISLYLLFVIPTYILPIYGSNSVFSYMMSGTNFYFWLHLLILLILIVLAKIRGDFLGKSYLIVFAQFALFFDLVPFVNFLPLAPSIMHCFVIVNGLGRSS